MAKDKKNVTQKIGELNLESINRVINSIESELEDLKKLLFNKTYQQTAVANVSLAAKEGKIIEGVFNGEEMIDSQGKHYQVPPNYASKSKLVPGDILKLTISSDGSFIYKQIGPIERQSLVGEIKEKNGKYLVEIGGKKYNVLQASITYYKLKTGDKVTLIIPKNQESNWAVIENKIVT